MDNKNFEGLEDFVEVRFTTGSNTNRVAPSPTRKIRGHYHFGSDGDIIYVHKDDQKKRPDLYKLIETKPTRKRGRPKKKAEAE